MYLVHDKQYAQRCDAMEIAYQLCREFSRHVPEWHVMKYDAKKGLLGYYVHDTITKETVLDMIVMEMGG